jgi:predicted AlkP superfamily phosphohydrolase/phosphomutase
MSSRRWPLLLVFALAAAAVGYWFSLPPLRRLALRTRPSGVKVLLVGIDGATFRVLDPLLAAGQAPQFKALMERGSRGVLRSENPMASPALWTTIATGRSRKDHGIEDFIVRKDPKRPRAGVLVGSGDRRTLALWNIVSGFGEQTGFLGWWASWPAEPVNGWIVSDRFTRERWNEWYGGSKRQHTAYPPELVQQLQPLVVEPSDPPMDEIDALVTLSPEERSEFLAAKKPLFGHGLSVFKYAYCSQRSYEKMALQLLAKAQPDLTGIFLVANDPVSHCFWHFYEPAAYAEGVDPEKAARLGQLVPNFYKHNDAYVGQLLKRVAPETVVLVVSDHGFEASRQLPALKAVPGLFEGPEAERAAMNGMVAVGQSGKHQLDGILIAAGGPIRRGAPVKATQYDIAPTILALLGLPVPRDMPGRVLEEILDPAFLEAHPVRRLASYESLIDRQAVEAAAEAAGSDDDEKKDLLRSLGYIQ